MGVDLSSTTPLHVKIDGDPTEISRTSATLALARCSYHYHWWWRFSLAHAQIVHVWLPCVFSVLRKYTKLQLAALIATVLLFANFACMWARSSSCIQSSMHGNSYIQCYKRPPAITTEASEHISAFNCVSSSITLLLHTIWARSASDISALFGSTYFSCIQ